MTRNIAAFFWKKVLPFAQFGFALLWLFGPQVFGQAILDNRVALSELKALASEHPVLLICKESETDWCQRMSEFLRLDKHVRVEAWNWPAKAVEKTASLSPSQGEVADLLEQKLRSLFPGSIMVHPDLVSLSAVTVKSHASLRGLTEGVVVLTTRDPEKGNYQEECDNKAFEVFGEGDNSAKNDAFGTWMADCHWVTLKKASTKKRAKAKLPNSIEVLMDSFTKDSRAIVSLCEKTSGNEKGNLQILSALMQLATRLDTLVLRLQQEHFQSNYTENWLHHRQDRLGSLLFYYSGLSIKLAEGQIEGLWGRSLTCPIALLARHNPAIVELNLGFDLPKGWAFKPLTLNKNSPYWFSQEQRFLQWRLPILAPLPKSNHSHLIPEFFDCSVRVEGRIETKNEASCHFSFSLGFKVRLKQALELEFTPPFGLVLGDTLAFKSTLTNNTDSMLELFSESRSEALSNLFPGKLSSLEAHSSQSQTFLFRQKPAQFSKPVTLNLLNQKRQVVLHSELPNTVIESYCRLPKIVTLHGHFGSSSMDSWLELLQSFSQGFVEASALTKGAQIDSTLLLWIPGSDTATGEEFDVLAKLAAGQRVLALLRPGISIFTGDSTIQVIYPEHSVRKASSEHTKPQLEISLGSAYQKRAAQEKAAEQNSQALWLARGEKSELWIAPLENKFIETQVLDTAMAAQLLRSICLCQSVP